MKLVLFNHNNLFSYKLSLLEGRVGTLSGVLVMSSSELEMVVDVCRTIWRRIAAHVHVAESFVGHIRFDLCPGFRCQPQKITWRGWLAFDLGPLEIVGIYEINVHSPECAAAVSALHRGLPELAKIQPSATSRLAQAIGESFGLNMITFVRGSGPVKKAWGQVFLEDLRKSLHIVEAEPECVMKSPPPIIWRWGDIRPNGCSEFSGSFCEFLKQLSSEKHLVFNSIPITPHQDIGNKKFLMPDGDTRWDYLVGRNCPLQSEDDLEWALKNQERLVCKPFLGSSGRNVMVGRLLSLSAWERALRERLQCGGYGLFEARWLPRIELAEVAPITLDINPAFWVDGRTIRYLYTVVRLDYWKNYWQRGVINVARGGGFAGTVLEDE